MGGLPCPRCAIAERKGTTLAGDEEAQSRRTRRRSRRRPAHPRSGQGADTPVRQVAQPCPRCSISSEAMANEPPNRARTLIGVGEEVGVTFSRRTARWTTTGGTISPTEGNTVLFTAPDRAGVVTITAEGRGCTSTITFTVIEPSAVLQRRAPGTGIKHTHNKPDIGMMMRVYLAPDCVNFQHVETIEEEVDAVDTGCYAQIRTRTHSPSTSPDTCTSHVEPGLGTRVYARDEIYSGRPSGSPPFAPGSRIWNIPVKFRVRGGAWRQFTTLTQVHTLAADGTTLTCSKGGGTSPAIQVSDPTSDY